MKKLLWLLVFIPFLVIAQGKPIVDGIKLIPQGAPVSPIEGELYYDDTSNTIFVYNGTTWLDLGAAGGGSQNLSQVLTEGNDGGGLNITNIGTLINSVNIQRLSLDGTSNNMSKEWGVNNRFQFRPSVNGVQENNEFYYSFLNDYWGFASGLRIEDLAGGGTQMVVADNDGDLSVQSIPTITDDQTASEVPLVDSGGNYTATDVEQAFVEVLSKDDDALEIATSGSRTNYTPTQQNVEFELNAIDDALGTITANGVGRTPIYEEDVVYTTAPTQLNFKGAGVSLSSPVSNQVDITIPGGGSTYTAPKNFILSTGVNVLTDANIHNSSGQAIINVLNVAGTGTAEISNLNPDEIDVFYFVVDLDGAILELTNSGTWSDSEIGTSTAIRLTGKGAKIGIEETADNSNEFRILPGYGVSYFTPDATPPLVTSATIENANPDQLVALFDESVDIIDVTGLSLDSGLSGLTFTGIISNVENSITFQLSGNAANGDAGNFVYGGTNTITDTEGNALVASSTAVTNNIAGTTNLFDGANAGDPENEVDGTANTGTSGGSPGIITSVSGDATDGTFALRLEHNNGASGRAIHYIEINSTFQASTTYQIQFDVKEVVGDATWDIAFNDSDGWESDTNTTLNETSGWTTVTVSKATLASFAGNFRFRIQTDAAAAAGDAVLIDNVRVTIP